MKHLHKRLFVAVDIPHEILRYISPMQESIKKSGLTVATYAQTHQLHITIAFLGEVPEDQIPDIKHALSAIVFNTMQASCGNIGTFEEDGQTRVIFMHIICHELRNLYERIMDELHSITTVHAQKFIPHITLARVKQTPDEQALTTFLNSVETPDYQFEISYFTLRESVATGQGHQHIDIQRYELV